MRGAESGEVIKPGNLKESELFRRITLPESDDDVMPSDGKPHSRARRNQNHRTVDCGRCVGH